MKKPDGVREGVLDQHPVGVPRDQLFHGRPPLVREQNGGLLVSEVLDVKLPEVAATETNRLLVNPGRAILAGGDIELDHPPGRARQQNDVLENLRRPAPERDERNAHRVQPCQLRLCRQPGVEDDLARRFAVRFFPERDEAEDLLRLLSLAEIRVGITEGPAFGILGQEDQDARLAAAAGRDVMTLYPWRFAIERHRVEVEIERFAGKETGSGDLFMPSREKLRSPVVIDARRVFREVTFFRNGIEPGKQSQSLVSGQRHHMAFPLDRPEFQGQAGAQRVLRRNHRRARQMSRQRAEPDQVGDKEKQPAAARRKGAGLEGKGADVRDRLDRRTGIMRTLLIQAPRQRSKSLLLQHFPHRGRTQRTVLLLQRLADLVHRVVLLAKTDNELASRRLLRLRTRAGLLRGEKERIRISSEVVAEDMERTDGIAESPGDLLRWTAFDEIGAQGLIHAVLGVTWFEKEAAAIA